MALTLSWPGRLPGWSTVAAMPSAPCATSVSTSVGSRRTAPSPPAIVLSTTSKVTRIGRVTGTALFVTFQRKITELGRLGETFARVPSVSASPRGSS